MKNILFYFGIIAIVFTVTSCNESVETELDLFSNEILVTKYSETIPFTVEQSIPEGEAVYRAVTNAQLVSALNPSKVRLLGDVVDPSFGKMKANVFGQLRPAITADTDLSNTTLDSIVLRLHLSGDMIYGDTNAIHSFEVYKLAKPMFLDSSYFFNENLELGEKIGSLENVTISRDSSQVYDYTSSGIDTIKTGAYISIRLDDSFGNSILNNDGDILTSTVDWLSFLNGIAIISTQPNNATVKVNLAYLTATSGTTMALYYKKEGELRDTYFGFNNFSPTSNYINHDLSNSILDGVTSASLDSIMPLKGAYGSQLEFKFGGLDSLINQNAIINKAVLSLNIEKTNDSYDPIPQLMLSYFSLSDDPSASNYIWNIDALIVNSAASGVLDGFGGTLEDKGDYYEVNMNIHKHFQEILLGEKENSLFLRPSPALSTFERSLIYGSKHPLYPSKLKLTYSISSTN